MAKNIRIWKHISMGGLIAAILLCACASEKPAESPTQTAENPTFSGIGALPTLPGVTPEPRPTLPVDEAQFPIQPDSVGQSLYEAHCASCHGINGEGQYPDPYAPNEQGLIGAPPHDNTGHTWH